MLCLKVLVHVESGQLVYWSGRLELCKISKSIQTLATRGGMAPAVLWLHYNSRKI